MIERDMAKSGRIFFRFRKYASTAVIVGGALVIWSKGGTAFADPLRQFSYDSFWIAVAIFGALTRLIASGFAALGTSGEGKAGAEAEELNTSGAYSLVRNPLYVGRVLTFTGLAFFTGAWEFGALVFCLSILFYERVIAYEETFLGAKFGDAYEDWCGRVPAFLPRLKGWVTPDRDWSWRRLFFRESFKVLDLASTIVLYGILRLYATTGLWQIEPAKQIVLLLLVAGYVTMITLKRFTAVFDGMS